MTTDDRPRGRRPKRYSQADRLARMMRMLSSRACTLKELAQAFRVTSRQVRRDLEEIEAEGHPLTASDEPGEKLWQLPLGYKGLPQIAITPYELMSLHLAKSQLAYLNDTPFLDDLNSMIEKVEAGLSAKTANHLERIVQAFSPIQRGTRAYDKKRNLLQQLRKAVLLQLRVKLTYKKPYTANASTYLVDPYALLLHEQGLYIRGYSHRSKEERLFAVDRMQNVAVSQDRFEIPASYSKDWYANRFGLIEEPPQEVKIRFSPDVAHFMKERQWHPTQQVKKVKGGAVEVILHAGGLDEIAWWVLSWGKEAKVLSPPKLVEIVTAQLSKSLRQYGRR